jgi:hypothetical protein
MLAAITDGFGLANDVSLQRDRCPRWQRNRHCAKTNQRQVDDGVFDTVETQNTHAITRTHRHICQSGGRTARTVPQLAVGDSLKSRQQLGDGSTGAGIVDEPHRALPDCRPARIPLHHGRRDLRQR